MLKRFWVGAAATGIIVAVGASILCVFVGLLHWYGPIAALVGGCITASIFGGLGHAFLDAPKDARKAGEAIRESS